ncbi:MAG: hypothetical protein R8K50_05285 [Mariprofundus sp.]
MEYIQCPHCLHKYGVNERMRAAVGKQIRCKQCQHAFHIIIINLPNRAADEADEQVKAAAEQPSVAKKGTDKPLTISKDQNSFSDSPDDQGDDAPPVLLKKKLNKQFIFSIVMVVTLTCAVILLFIYLQFPQWLDFHAQSNQSAATSPLIKPMKLFPDGPPQAKSPIKKLPPVDDNAGRNKSMLEGPDQPSQVCRDASAAFWLRVNIMSNSRLETRTYHQLLDQGLGQPAEIRNLCRDRFLAGRLTEAAKQAKRPEWINHEIDLLTE